MSGRLKFAAGSALAAALALSACGVRGNLEPPPEAKAQQAAAATADSGQGKAEGAAPRPHKGFILDGLLR
ncbi:MAG TPA: lipoprotein [Hyphomicrobiaceae bacterium]|nr:lipoprotein [Hyphomicrobiaceae bacterium]